MISVSVDGTWVAGEAVLCDCWCCRQDAKRVGEAVTRAILWAIGQTGSIAAEVAVPCPCAECSAARALMWRAEHGGSDAIAR